MFRITDSIREIIFPLQGQHPEFVFTYVAVYGNKRLGRVRGQRYPLTLSGVKSRWQRMRAKAGVTDFRFHDFRHDFGSKLLRDNGNLKLVQKAMNHRDIKSTLRYAHVLDDDVAAAVEKLAQSRTKSRTAVRKVSSTRSGRRIRVSRCRLRLPLDWWRWCRSECPACSPRPITRRSIP